MKQVWPKRRTLSQDGTPKRAVPRQWERGLQKSIVAFHGQVVRDPRDAVLFAVPNGELRDDGTAGMLSGRGTDFAKMGGRDLVDFLDAWEKDRTTEPTPAILYVINALLSPAGLGVLAGACDLILAASRVVFIECKLEKTDFHARTKQSTEQRTFAYAAARLGHDYRVIRSPEEYHRLLIELGVALRISGPLLRYG